jgi:hypothetical protein
VWPVIGVALGLVVVGALVRLHAGRAGHAPGGGRRGWWAGAVLLAGETAFLVAAGAPLVSSSPTFLTPTPDEAALQAAVGSALVGFGTRDCHVPPGLGIHPNVNVVFGVHELASYDPMTPLATFRSLSAATGQPAAAVGAPLILCPAITTATAARLFGVGYVLEPAGGRRPRGTVPAGHVDGEALYRVPGAAAATLTVPGAGGAAPGPDAPATAVAVSHPGPASWRLRTDAPGPRVLRIHLTDVPGWHASIDGRPLPLTRFDGAMLEADVPAGHHTVELHYWPTAFSVGIVLAVLSVLGLAAGVLVDRRRREGPSAAQQPGGAAGHAPPPLVGGDGDAGVPGGRPA